MIRTSPEAEALKAILAAGCPEQEGKFYGVTRVLGGTKDMSGLEAWRKRVGEEEADRIVEESKKIGNSLDKLFNDSLEDPEFNIEDHKDTLGYKLWIQLRTYLKNVVPVAVQMRVWNNDLKYMGYLDCLGFYKGKLTLIDCKNSKKEKQEQYLEDYYLQCTAYCMALYQMYGIKVTQLCLMIARRDSSFPQVIVRPIAPYIPKVIARAQQYHLQSNTN
ncbi:nuclease [Stenotrophomonas phage Moby]|uniref:Nuclease n=1 Tax=Stenotrophomonas phage Moby TaxID=2601680 RepID=A0A5P8PM42_9CAUD|nr:exonuclease [Stenotrophomonas phage Moby]QFR57811.1 nuclease [Stenotrophomonas phage Moby]